MIIMEICVECNFAINAETEVQMVNQMPRIAANQQPTIAIITANYCEKLAVDAMMDNKTTFVKYKTEGRTTCITAIKETHCLVLIDHLLKFF